MTTEILFLWPLVFEYLEPEDLVSVSCVCLAWWQFVFQGRKSTAQVLQHCEQLWLANTGKMHRKPAAILRTGNVDKLGKDCYLR